MNDEILLIGGEPRKDGIGQNIITPSETQQRAVFAEIKSIGMNEHYLSRRDNKNPTMKAVIFADEYSDEPFIGYGGKVFEINRHSKEGEKIALICEVTQAWA